MPPNDDEKILVVDDNPVKRYTITRTLEQAGFSVTEAETGAEGLRLAAQKICVAVLDVKLPDINGFELCRRIKSNPETAHVLVLHLSAHNTSGPDLARGLEEGADAYLAVPVESAVLVATVRALLRLHRAEAAARHAATVWSTTFDAISDAVFLVDPAGIIRRGNVAAGALLYRMSDTLPGMAFSQALAALGLDNLPDIKNVLEHCGAAEAPTLSSRWVRLNVDALPAKKDEETTDTVCIFSDITDRVTADQMREEAASKNERIAETLQRSLLLTPTNTATFPGLEVAGVYEPALSEAMVGGDFSDVFSLDDQCVALVVGDVTGKGLAAAAYTAEIKFSLRALLRQFPQPDQALLHLNRHLCAMRRLDRRDEPAKLNGVADFERFVSLAVVVLDTKRGSAHCAAAGAEPPLVVRFGSGASEEVFDACGPLLAMDAESMYNVAEVRLGTNDVLLLATDGVTEAHPPRKAHPPRRSVAFFGMDGMAEAAHAAANGSLQEVVDGIARAALQFAEKHQHDDICILAARCTENANNAVNKVQQ